MPASKYLKKVCERYVIAVIYKLQALTSMATSSSKPDLLKKTLLTSRTHLPAVKTSARGDTFKTYGNGGTSRHQSSTSDGNTNEDFENYIGNLSKHDVPPSFRGNDIHFSSNILYTARRVIFEDPKPSIAKSMSTQYPGSLFEKYGGCSLNLYANRSAEALLSPLQPLTKDHLVKPPCQLVGIDAHDGALRGPVTQSISSSSTDSNPSSAREKPSERLDGPSCHEVPPVGASKSCTRYTESKITVSCAPFSLLDEVPDTSLLDNLEDKGEKLVKTGKRIMKKTPLEKSSSMDTDNEENDSAPEVTSSHTKTKKRRRRPKVTANLTGTHFEVVQDMVEYMGYIISQDDDPDWMARAYPLEYNFVPKTWILPSEFLVFQTYARDMKAKKKQTRTFIMKPSNGAMGNGIMLLKNPDKVFSCDHMIVQEYLEKPFLVDGFKCDMRIYVLITSCDPLRIFLFNDGLLRMSTSRYSNPAESNLENLFMHLTNYSINKHSENYIKDHAGTTGSKRSLSYFNEYLRQSDYNVNALWQKIIDLILKTIIVAHPHIYKAYRMCRPAQPPGSDSVCFEILGFDIMLDRKLKPWLLEINRAPSFATNEQLDYDIKSGLLEDAFRLLNIKGRDKKKNMAEEKAQAQRRLLKPRARGDISETTESDKRLQSIEKRKEQLNGMLDRIQKEEEREDFENRHCGRYRRIFPPVDRLARDRYSELLFNAFKVFLAGQGHAGILQDIESTYCCRLKEYEIREMLAECEAEEAQEATAAASAEALLLSKPKKTETLRQLTTSMQNALKAYNGRTIYTTFPS